MTIYSPTRRLRILKHDMALARARVSFKARAGGYAPARRGPSGPHALDARVRQHISGAWAASTMRSSPSQVQYFLQYSAGEGVSIDMVLPAVRAHLADGESWLMDF